MGEENKDGCAPVSDLPDRVSFKESSLLQRRLALQCFHCLRTRGDTRQVFLHKQGKSDTVMEKMRRARWSASMQLRAIKIEARVRGSLNIERDLELRDSEDISMVFSKIVRSLPEDRFESTGFVTVVVDVDSE